MKYIYTILFLLLTTFAGAQTTKGAGSPSEMVQVKIVKFYPNPATTFINFELLEKAERTYSLQIYNLTGKKVFEASDIMQKTTVSVSDFFRGIYIYQLRDRSGKIVESGKFQVK